MENTENRAYIKMSLLTPSPLKCEYEDGDLNISIGLYQYISFTEEYILANKESFQRIANTINAILQENGA